MAYICPNRTVPEARAWFRTRGTEMTAASAKAKNHERVHRIKAETKFRISVLKKILGTIRMAQLRAKRRLRGRAFFGPASQKDLEQLLMMEPENRQARWSLELKLAEKGK